MSRPIALVVFADLWWGLSPLFWNELDTVEPVDQLGWRIVFGAVTLAGFWSLRRKWPFPPIDRRRLVYGLAALAAVFANWSFFLWAVANEQAVEAALGYFLMPIVSTALAIGLLGERLRPLQAGALLLAGAGLVWMFVRQGGVPWVALVLGVTFALYGLLRKQGPWGALEGLTFEMFAALPVGILLLVGRFGGGQPIEGDGAASTWTLIALTGLVTVVPLVLFANAARSAPLIAVGLLQYIVPITQFLVGWRLLGESVSLGRFVGFALIWAALALVVADQLRPAVRLQPWSRPAQT